MPGMRALSDILVSDVGVIATNRGLRRDECRTRVTSVVHRGKYRIILHRRTLFVAQGANGIQGSDVKRYARHDIYARDASTFLIVVVSLTMIPLSSDHHC